MASRYRLFRRGGTYYLHDAITRKQKSLGTKSRKEALRVLNAQREAEQVPNIARQIARAYLHTADPEAATRTWQTVADRIVADKEGTLHSYRYSWAERAAILGFPERYAQLALGHNSKAVHRAYSKKAEVTLPSLEDYEKAFKAKVIPFAPKPVNEVPSNDDKSKKAS